MSNCKNMPGEVQAIQAAIAGLGALKQSKIAKAQDGEKIYTKPKTIFGKLIGGVSGRTAAAEVSSNVKTSPLSESVMYSLQPKSSNLDPSKREGFPVSGGLSFGGEASRKTYLPFAIVAAIVAAFYFMRKKGSRRRR